MDISKRIREIREAKRLKQSDIAAILNTDTQNYSRLEKRGKRLSIQQLEDISNALGVRIDVILGFEEPPIQIERDLLHSYMTDIQDLKERLYLTEKSNKSLEIDISRLLLNFEMKIILFFEKHNKCRLVIRYPHEQEKRFIDYEKFRDEINRENIRVLIESSQIHTRIHDFNNFEKVEDNTMRTIVIDEKVEHEIDFTSIDKNKMTIGEIKELSSIIEEYKDYKVVIGKYPFILDVNKYLKLSIK